MKVNKKEIIGNEFAYDGCHKIYIIEDNIDKQNALGFGYEIYPITELKRIYEESCPLRFISNWKLNVQYVRQCRNARFEI